MKELLLLIAMFCQVDDRTIYVVVDNTENSKILKSELTRDWTAGKHTNSVCEDLNCYRIELSSKLKIIDRFNPNEREQYSVPDIDVYPSYRVGLYRRFEPFPPETFTTTSFPLLTTVALQHNMFVDTYTWKRYCRSRLHETKISYASKVGDWMFKVDVRKATSIFVNFHCEDGMLDEVMKDVITTHSKNESFPKFIPPTFTSPIMPLPWETNPEQVLNYFSVIE